MKHNPDTGAQYVETLDSSNQTKVDANADGNTYFGEAAAGTATSAPAWKIQRMSVSGSTNTFQWANGTAGASNVWDNRTSLTYS